MTKTPRPSQVSLDADSDPTPPRGLSKAEKSEFRRVCGLRRQAGNPVRAIEVDLLSDYCQTRARLVIWQRKLKHGQTRERDTFAGYSRDERMLLSEQLTLAATIDRTAAACRRLARDLRLTGA